MVNRIIKEIQQALDNNLYIIALTAALTLPDICGKAEYRDLNTTARYKKWYKENIGQYEIDPDNRKHGIDMPYLSEDVIYNLRCSLLHQGTPNIDEKHNIQFSLIIEEKNEFDIYCDAASCGGNERTYSVSIRRLCCILCWTAESFYKKNREKFNFINYTITDIDEEFRKREFHKKPKT